MPTKPIPAGTVNLSVNIPKTFRDEIGRHCFKLDRSIGDWARELFSRALSAANAVICFRTEARIAAEKDRQGLRIMRAALKDGCQPHDLPVLIDAMALFSESAERDERIATADQNVGQLARA